MAPEGSSPSVSAMKHWTDDVRFSIENPLPARACRFKSYSLNHARADDEGWRN